jgi:hypothetical protein
VEAAKINPSSAIFMRRPLKKAKLIQKEASYEGSLQIYRCFPFLRKKGRRGGEECLSFFPLLFLCILFLVPAACQHAPDALQEAQGVSYIFEANEQVIFKALSRVFKDRGFGESQIEVDKGRVETDYVILGGWRTKAVATIKKISPKEREVTVSIITEQKDSGPSGWKPKKLIGQEQYETFFNELELQIYREWYKGE